MSDDVFAGVTRVLLVGDSHTNTQWWKGTVVPAALDAKVDAIIQLGDFGWWDEHNTFRTTVADSPLPVWFLDGNHEQFPALKVAVADARKRNSITDPTAPVPLFGNLGYLPRGARFTIDGVTFCAVGGAHSIDRPFRKIGVSYFFDECITIEESEIATAGGHADVLLCHDAPSGWEIPGLAPLDMLPVAWQKEESACHEHREILREIYEELTPKQVVHGHYHRMYSKAVDESWGTVFIDGLNCDGTHGSIAVFETDDDGNIQIERLSGRTARRNKKDIYKSPSL